ncbi:hypothetical protein [Breznakia pachnodae]|uniref:Uncharacterized protein n=1 Tax=Breznakia pachnodae TaxID=265178 RepID=A0ABU0E402_9FIRM|nr:hypothetical protein [Breznakia pachnodae]MDQ0361556.1 hypothetical protein [Breznakia pachnodae]
MKYFYAVCEEGTQKLYSSKVEVEKNDVVVIPPYYDEEDLPLCARVVTVISSMKALTSVETPIEIIQKVDMDEYIEKVTKEKEDIILFNKMDSKMAELKKIEQLKKYASLDPEMKKMFDEYTRKISNEEIGE